MTGDDRNKAVRAPGKPRRREAQAQPGWASGLRELYDSVLDEPLPDTFKDLLSKLDDGT